MARLHVGLHSALDDATIKQLRSSNINTVFDFVEHEDEKLAKLIKWTFKDVRDFKKVIIHDFSGKIKNGAELLSLEEDNIVSTGISCLDELLEGGLHPGQLYEICGLSSAGKTQLCHSLAINVILETNGIVHYIDTKRDFSAGRVQMILEAQNHNDEKAARVMNQINVTRVTNIYELFSVLHSLKNSLKIMKNEKPTKLVIIDSIYTLILASFEDSHTFYILNHLANVTRFIANEFNIALVTVNLIKEWRDVEHFGQKNVKNCAVVKPTLGKFWLQIPNTRLLIQKLEKEDRKISVWKSFDLEIGTSCCVDVTNSGVTQHNS